MFYYKYLWLIVYRIYDSINYYVVCKIVLKKLDYLRNI